MNNETNSALTTHLEQKVIPIKTTKKYNKQTHACNNCQYNNTCVGRFKNCSTCIITAIVEDRRY